MKNFTDEQRKRRAEITAEVYREWVTDLDDVTPDPEFSTNEPTQYPETAEILSAPLGDQINLRRRTLRRFDEAGLISDAEREWLAKANEAGA